MVKGTAAIILASTTAAWSGTAAAQIATDAAPDGGQVQTSAPPAEERAPDLALEGIIVTAQKREQSLQQVPISIAVFGEEAIDALNAENVGDLDTFTPGLSINDTSVTQPSYSIRGVRTDDFGIGTEPSIGIFVDGVYSARSGSALIFFNDVDRVEVLKGPQGTLFGRNTSAGAISIVTNLPVARTSLDGTLRIGNFDKRRLDLTGNVALTDTLFVRANGVINRRDGYLVDAITREDREREHNTSGRLAVRWAPQATTDFILTYDHDDTDKDGPAAVGISVFALSQDPFGPFANDVINNRETRILNSITFTADHAIGPVALTSITNYKQFETHNREDEDGTADPTRYLDTENIERNKSFYQELRGTYGGTRLNLLVGGSYFREHGRQTSAVTLLSDSVDRLLGAVADFPIFTILDSVGLPVFNQAFREDMNNEARNESYAAFGDATFRLTPQLSVIGGIRYTHDNKRFTWMNGGFSAPGLEAVTAPGALYNAILGAELLPAGTAVSAADFFRATVGPNGLIFDVGALEGVPFTREETFSDVSPRFVVQYQPRNELLLYASATRGYKAGGFNSVQINSFFEPETVWNFESGVKSEVFNRRLRLNASAYYFKYKNRQSISLEDTGGNLPQYITRSGDSEAWGVDFETQFVATPDLTLSLIGGYIESSWVTRVERGVDISGQPTGEPLFTGVASAHYARTLDTQGTIFADASYSYTSKVRINDADRLLDAAIAPFVDFSRLGKLRGDRNIVTARVGYRLPGDRLSASLYVENLLDDQTPRTLNDISADIFQTPYIRLDRPRFYGVELDFTF